eukprot:TRINITY_DN102660_c0_g1_i1.p1 TRINITY_DN102660_c0_g1~~TRINITY_DN102660_c0_g1_i1.p1  ORF type:complete len:698 (-),score=197.64 TRINITY_DN102660_c0_g1_i1:240-2333(-)
MAPATWEGLAFAIGLVDVQCTGAVKVTRARLDRRRRRSSRSDGSRSRTSSLTSRSSDSEATAQVKSRSNELCEKLLRGDFGDDSTDVADSDGTLPAGTAGAVAAGLVETTLDEVALLAAEEAALASECRRLESRLAALGEPLPRQRSPRDSESDTNSDGGRDEALALKHEFEAKVQARALKASAEQLRAELRLLDLELPKQRLAVEEGIAERRAELAQCRRAAAAAESRSRMLEEIISLHEGECRVAGKYWRAQEEKRDLSIDFMSLKLAEHCMTSSEYHASGQCALGRTSSAPLESSPSARSLDILPGSSWNGGSVEEQEQLPTARSSSSEQAAKAFTLPKPTPSRWRQKAQPPRHEFDFPVALSSSSSSCSLASTDSRPSQQESSRGLQDEEPALVDGDASTACSSSMPAEESIAGSSSFPRKGGKTPAPAPQRVASSIWAMTRLRRRSSLEAKRRSAGAGRLHSYFAFPAPLAGRCGAQKLEEPPRGDQGEDVKSPMKRITSDPNWGYRRRNAGSELLSLRLRHAKLLATSQSQQAEIDGLLSQLESAQPQAQQSEPSDVPAAKTEKSRQAASAPSTNGTLGSEQCLAREDLQKQAGHLERVSSKFEAAMQNFFAITGRLQMELSRGEQLQRDIEEMKQHAADEAAECARLQADFEARLESTEQRASASEAIRLGRGGRAWKKWRQLVDKARGS